MTILDELTQRKHAMTVKELADLLNFDTETVYRAVRNRTLPAYRVCSSLRFDPRAVANWLRERSA